MRSVLDWSNASVGDPAMGLGQLAEYALQLLALLGGLGGWDSRDRLPRDAGGLNSRITRF